MPETHSLQVNRTLASLELDFNNLGPQGAALIGDVLKVTAAARMGLNVTQVNHKLSGLSLSTNELGPQGAVMISDALKVA